MSPVMIAKMCRTILVTTGHVTRDLKNATDQSDKKTVALQLFNCIIGE